MTTPKDPDQIFVEKLATLDELQLKQEYSDQCARLGHMLFSIILKLMAINNTAGALKDANAKSDKDNAPQAKTTSPSDGINPTPG